MRKIVAIILATGLMIVGVAATTVSAETYEVLKGDNLWNIAKDHDTTVEAIIKINELDTTVIQPKQILAINEIYEVEKGDTLQSIAADFDVMVRDIRMWNDLDSDVIVVGQELKIKGLYQDEKVATKEVADSAPEKVAKSEKATKTEKVTKSEAKPKPEGKTMSVTATAYTAECDGCSGITYTGVDLNKDRNAKVIAVDPNVIPLGSKVHVEGYGNAIAADIGGAIKGNKIDLHVPTKDEAYSWGVRTVNITILN